MLFRLCGGVGVGLRNSLDELNLQLLCRSLSIVFWVKQVPHSKAPNLICMLQEGKHYTLATFLIIMHC